MHGLFCVWVGGLRRRDFYLCQARNMRARVDAFLTPMAVLKAHVHWHLQKCTVLAWAEQKGGLYIVFLTNDPSSCEQKKRVRKMKEVWSLTIHQCSGCTWRMATTITSEACQKYYRGIYVLVKQSIMCPTHVVFSKIDWAFIHGDRRGADMQGDNFQKLGP